MRWSEVDLEAALRTLPAGRVKNGKAHDVPLSQAALDGLAGLPRIGDKFVITNSAWHRRATTQRASACATRCCRRCHPGACTTGLQKLGIRLEVTEAVLNHVSGSRAGVTGVYQRHTWDKEKWEALEAWGRHVVALAQPNVKAFRAARPKCFPAGLCRR